jgi:hypothetical protein
MHEALLRFLAVSIIPQIDKKAKAVKHAQIVERRQKI